MAKPKITLYVDIVSPFGYLAYWFVRHAKVFEACDVTFKPILLGGVMKACGNTPPLYIKNKDKWIAKERTRWASQFDIPMRETMPAGFPIPTVTVQRVLCAIEKQSPSHLIVALDTLFAALWAPPQGTEHDVKSVETISALLSPESVLGGALTKTIVASIGSPEVKSHLTQNTDEAIANGAFGLPWFHCTNTRGEVDGFWGFDHLGQVARFLELDGEHGDLKLRPML